MIRFLQSLHARQFMIVPGAVMSILVAIVATTAGRENLPTAQWVLARYAEVSGERANLLKHKSATIHGRYQVPADKLEATTVSYTKGGVSVQRFQLADGRHGASGYDGHVGWGVGLSGKVTIHTGDEARSMARDADMYYHLHVMQYFKSLEVAGVDDFNGRPCYHLKGINNWNQPNEQFYDKENGLLLGYKFDTKWRGGNGAADVIFEDYKLFDGILFSTRQIGHDGNDMDITFIDSVSWDDVPDSALELPSVVKAKLAENPKQ